MNIIDMGYGVDTSAKSYQYRPDARHYIMENLASKSLKEEYKNFREENEDLNEEEALDVFFNEYEDEETGNCDIEGVLVRCMNENECGGRNVFRYDNYCIYVRNCIPKDEEERSKMLTMEEISVILAKYLNPILKSLVTIESLDIYDQ